MLLMENIKNPNDLNEDNTYSLIELIIMRSLKLMQVWLKYKLN